MNRKIITICCSAVLLLAQNAYAKSWEELEKQITDAISSAQLGRHSVETDFKSEGILTVTGYVSSIEDKNLVEERLKEIPGITTIKNELIIREDVARVPSPEEKKLNDKIIAAVSSSIINAKYDLVVESSSGNVILKGNAADEGLIKRIENIAKGVAGVKSVSNGLQVIAPPSDTELEARIREAFNAEDNLQAEDISIQASNGIVTLNGKKNSHRVIDRILSIAQMVDGVKKIVSNIALTN